MGLCGRRLLSATDTQELLGLGPRRPGLRLKAPMDSGPSRALRSVSGLALTPHALFQQVAPGHCPQDGCPPDVGAGEGERGAPGRMET